MNKQSGLSLIELMVALAISAVLMMGVMSLFISSRQGYQTQQSSGILQENGRFAVTTLDTALRMADYWGGASGSNSVTLSSNVGTLQGSDACGIVIADSSSQITSGLIGYAGGTSVPSAFSGCIDANDYVPNTDIIVVRFADPDYSDAVESPAPTSSSGPTTYTANNLYVYSLPGFGSYLMKGSDSGSVPSSIQGNSTYPAYGQPYIAVAFFIRPCATKTGGTCSSTDDGGHPRPTLTELIWNSADSEVEQQPLVDGIEMFRTLYGVDTDGDKNADQYVDAGSVSDWQKVVSVRYSIVARTSTTDSNQPDTHTYTLIDSYTFDPSTIITNGIKDTLYQHRVYNSLVQIRNRVRG